MLSRGPEAARHAPDPRPVEDPRARRPLDRDEEVQLCLAAQAGDRRAQDRLVRTHMRLVVRLARRYLRAGVALEDLVNEGNIGLVRAVRKYDPGHGLPFVPYAIWWVKQAMIMFLIQHGQGAISLPIRKVQLHKRVRREESELSSLLGRPPRDDELASRLGRSEHEVREARSLAPEYVAWEDYLRQDRAGPDEQEAHPAEARVDQAHLRAALLRAVAQLPDRDQRGVRMYFGLDGGHGMNFADLGRHLAMTREGARQLIRRSLARLRDEPSNSRLTAYL